MSSASTKTIAKRINALSQQGRSAIMEELNKRLQEDLQRDIIAEMEGLSDAELKELSKKVKGGKGRKRKDPNAPKGVTGPYIFFCQKIVPKLKEQHMKEHGTEMKHKDATVKAGALWKNLSEEQKQPFVQMSAKDKARYKKEMESYVPGPVLEEGDKPRKTKKAKDPNAPKRNINAFMWFSPDKRRELAEGGMSGKEARDEAGRLWKAMTEEERTPFTDLAARDKARYQKEKAAYEAKKAEPVEKPEPMDVDEDVEEDSSDVSSSSE